MLVKMGSLVGSGFWVVMDWGSLSWRGGLHSRREMTKRGHYVSLLETVSLRRGEEETRTAATWYLSEYVEIRESFLKFYFQTKKEI